jgi:hypothetical protein
MKYLALFVSFALALPALAQEKLELRQLIDDRVTMLVPGNFMPLEEKYRLLKYPGAGAPNFVLSDETTRFNLAAELKSAPMPPEALPELAKAIPAKLSQAKFHSAGMRTLNGHEFAVFDMDTPAEDGTIRNIMAMTSLDGKLLVISYNCLISTDAGCDLIGRKIIESIKLTQPEAAERHAPPVE